MAGKSKKGAEFSTGERFRLFVERARAMSETRLIRESAQVNFSMRFESRTGTVMVQLPDTESDDLRALLSHVRPFLLEKDALFFTRVMNLALRSSVDSELSARLTELQELWKRQYINGGTIPIVINDERVTARLAFDLIMNSGINHNVPEKIDRLRSMDDPWPLVRAQLHLSLAPVTQMIFYLADYIETGLSRGAFVFPDEQGSPAQ